MTKDELKKEAEENCVCTDKYMRKMFEIGYIAGAEPREKRIAELEQENAELKEALKGKRCNCMTYFNFKDLEKQLTKAKDIIREFVEWATWQGSNCPNFKNIQDKAEQFLKESE